MCIELYTRHWNERIYANFQLVLFDWKDDDESHIMERINTVPLTSADDSANSTYLSSDVKVLQCIKKEPPDGLQCPTDSCFEVDVSTILLKQYRSHLFCTSCMCSFVSVVFVLLFYNCLRIMSGFTQISFS